MRALQHRFADLPVLDNLSFEVAAGQFIAIVGPSGCGKSTVLRVLAGLLVPTSGTAAIGDANIIGQPGSVAYLPQADSLLRWRRALGNAMVGAEVAGVDRSVAEDRARKLFERFGLVGFEHAWPHELSGGMRQRVGVLRTFLIPRAVLGLDEPFSALDALTRVCMQQWLEQVWMDDPRTTILVTHDVEEALLLADRVLVMSCRPGRILDDIAVHFERPRGLEVSTSRRFIAAKRHILGLLGPIHNPYGLDTPYREKP